MLLRQPKCSSSDRHVNYHLAITVVSTLTIVILSITYYRLTGDDTSSWLLFKSNNVATKSQWPAAFPKLEQQTRQRRAGSKPLTAISPSALLYPKSKSDLVAPPSSSAPSYFIDEGGINDNKKGSVIKDNAVFEGPPTFQNAQSSSSNNRAISVSFPVETAPNVEPLAFKEEPDTPTVDCKSNVKRLPNDLDVHDRLKNFPIDQWLDFVQMLIIFRDRLLDDCLHAKLLMHSYVDRFVDENPAWFWAAICSMIVVSTGIVPAFFVPECNSKNIQTKNPQDISQQCDQKKTRELRLNQLLCFAVGSLLGDVFFHLLPESWNGDASKLWVGLYVIGGLLVCLLIEKFCAKSEESQHYVAALANLAANIMDNFTHGLAVGGSFLISKRLGFLTTFAILLHEIPHEISDFAILLRADFDKWSALKAQLITASGGLLGTFVAFSYNSKGSSSNLFVEDGNAASWILPFTAGGFLNIALIQILPDILKERRFKESINQILLIFAGIAAMALLNSPLIFPV